MAPRTKVEHRCPKCTASQPAYTDETVYCLKHPNYRKGIIGVAMRAGVTQLDARKGVK